MPSPFPGMNPYIEQDAYWQDFHLEFLPAIRERLVVQVRPKYIVLLDEHIYVHELPREPRRLSGGATSRSRRRLGRAPRRVSVSEFWRPPRRFRSPRKTSAASLSSRASFVHGLYWVYSVPPRSIRVLGCGIFARHKTETLSHQHQGGDNDWGDSRIGCAGAIPINARDGGRLS
ncbi:MAG: DUF4058 family protein [Isosphaeraceae bacterium]